MALSPAQLLKRKQKKNKARTEKARAINQRSQLHHLPEWPIVGAYAPFHSRDEYTMQYSLIVRQCPNGKVAIGAFLIDLLCLGVKDSFMKIVPGYQLSEFLHKIENTMPMDEVPPAYIATLVHEAVNYSRGLGLNPRGDYLAAKKFLEGIPLDPSLTFTFGENGQPVYVAGPNDSPEFVNAVLATLSKTVGEDNYKFVVPMEVSDERDD